MIQKLNPNEILEEAAAAREQAEADAEPPPLQDWVPDLGPTQEEIYWSEATYILAHGERGSGKTWGILHKLVRHCYEWDNANVQIVSLVRVAATEGGAWEKLISEAIDPETGEPLGVLAQWKKGIGLEYDEPRQDDAKNRYVIIYNQYGNPTKIMLRSMPIKATIAKRVKGQEMSIFFFDELTETGVDEHEYFTKVIQQIGRRAGIPGKAQQYIGACNPAEQGEDHWVWKYFNVLPHETDADGKVTWDDDYAVFHVPMAENKWMPDKERYLKNVMIECKSDPTAYDRLILGKWTKKVSGNSIFKFFFFPHVHVKGEIGKGLFPFPEDPIIIGYDPGDVNNARTFGQRNPLGNKFIWRYFDEVVDYKVQQTFRDIVMAVLDKMFWWMRFGTRQFGNEFRFMYAHVSDRAAKTHWNPHGSFDFLEYERISEELIEETPRYRDIGLQPIRMVAPMKGPGSVAERVKCLCELLSNDELFISANCVEIIDMFHYLKKKKDARGAEDDYGPQRTKHLHVFDAASYPPYFYATDETAEWQVGTPREKSKGLAFTQFGT